MMTPLTGTRMTSTARPAMLDGPITPHSRYSAIAIVTGHAHSSYRKRKTGYGNPHSLVIYFLLLTTFHMKWEQ